MDDRTPAKYASEVEAFASVFARFGRSIYGLVLLEIGWLAVLGLYKNVAGTSGAISLGSIAWIGLVAVATAWSAFAAGSRAFTIGLVLINAVRDLASALLVFLALCLNAILFPFAYLRERRGHDAALSEVRRLWEERRAKRLTNTGAKDGQPATDEAAWRAFLGKQRFDRKTGKMAVIAQLRQEGKLEHDRWGIVQATFVLAFVRARRRRGPPRLGFAPARRYELGDSRRLDVFDSFSLAAFRIAADVSELVFRGTVELTQVRTRSNIIARRARELAAYDALIASRVVHPTRPLLRIEYHDLGVAREANGTGPPDTGGVFPGALSFGWLRPALVSLAKARAVDFALLVAAVQLEASQRLPDEARLDRLVLEIVRRVGAIDEMPPDLYLAVEAQATRLSCSWIGYQMQLEWDLNDGIWTAPDQAAGLFRSALETALESGVDVAANAYRSGAVACLLRDEPGALVYFERAVNEDSSIPIDGAMREAVLFQMCVLDTLKTFGYGGCRDDRRFACAAASAARAIHFGRGDLISGDLDKYEASALAATKSQVQGTAIGVVKSMLRSA